MADNETPRKKRGCLGCLTKLLGLTLILVAVGVIAIRAFVPGIIKTQAETIGTQMLGTPVTIGEVSLSVLSGRAELKNIAIANYPGFSEKNLLSIGKAGGDVSLSALLAGNIHVQSVWTDDPVVNLEVNRQGEQNLKVLLDKLSTSSADTETSETVTEDPTEAPPAELPEIRLDEFKVTGIKVNFIDDFASDHKITNGLGLKTFRIDDIRIPATGDANASSVMTVTAAGLGLRSSDAFAKPDFLTSGETKVRLDLGRMMATLNSPERLIQILDITNADTAIVTQTLVKNESDVTPQNLREFMVIAMNTSVPGDPKTFAQADEAARKSSEETNSKVKEAAKGGILNSLDAFANTMQREVTGAAEDLKVAEAKLAEDSALAEILPSTEPINRISIATVNVKGFTFENINVPDAYQNLKILSTEADVNNVIWPHVDGTITDVAVRTHLLDTEGKITLKTRGEFMKAIEGGRVDVASDMINQQLAGVPGVKQGRLNSNLNLVVENKRAVGKLTFSTKGFKFAENEAPSTPKSVGDITGTFAGLGAAVGKGAIEQALAAHEKSGAPPFEIPIDYSIDELTLQDLSQGLAKAISKNITGSISVGLEGIGAQLGDLGKQLNTDALNKTLNDATSGLGDVGGSTGKELEKATDKVDGAIQGLFGKKKKKEEE